MFDPVFAAVGEGLRVVGQAASVPQARVVWLVTLAGSAAWITERGRRWLRPGSILVFTPRDRLPTASPAPRGGWRAVALAFAGPAAYQNGRYLERRFGSMQQLSAQSRPVTLAAALADTGPGTLAKLEGERAGADWVAELHRHLLHHHTPLSALFTMGPDDAALEPFAGRTVKDLALEMGFSRTYLTRKLATACGDVDLHAFTAFTTSTPSRSTQ